MWILITCKGEDYIFEEDAVMCWPYFERLQEEEEHIRSMFGQRG